MLTAWQRIGHPIGGGTLIKGEFGVEGKIAGICEKGGDAHGGTRGIIREM